jgi:hypothetical protein
VSSLLSDNLGAQSKSVTDNEEQPVTVTLVESLHGPLLGFLGSGEVVGKESGVTFLESSLEPPSFPTPELFRRRGTLELPILALAKIPGSERVPHLGETLPGRALRNPPGLFLKALPLIEKDKGILLGTSLEGLVNEGEYSRL